MNKNMANIDHYHGDDVRHMELLQGSPPPIQYAASHLFKISYPKDTISASGVLGS